MASCSQQNKDSSSKQKEILFFKIIIERSIREKKLRLPSSFVRNHGNGLSSPAILTVEDGSSWKIELDKCNGDVWLHNGWETFLDAYSLKHGHIMLFEYKGNSEFSVNIFDKSATEIDYSVKPKTDVNFHNPTGRGKSPIPCAPPQKKVRTDESGNDVGTSKSEFKEGGKQKCQQAEKKQQHKMKKPHQAKKKPEKHHIDALRRARAFKLKNPFFLLAMQPTSLSKTSRLCVPTEPSKKFFNKSEGHIILYVSSEKSWLIKYNRNESTRRIKWGRGWRTFTKDSNLKNGDVCIFELVEDNEEPTFKVSIFRVAEDECGSDKDQQLSHDEMIADRQPDESPPQPRKIPAAESASKFDSEYPFCQVVMKATYLQKDVHLPIRFVREHMQHWKKRIILHYEDGFWPVTFCNLSKRLRAGWEIFAKENSVQVGEVCIFELIDRNKCLIKVSIVRNQN